VFLAGHHQADRSTLKTPLFLHGKPGRIDHLYEYPTLEVFRYMLVGYMRVSSDSDRQTTDLQRDALVTAGVDARHLFEDKASGARDDRPGLKKCLEYVKSGDTLVVWKLDRLGRSLTHLLTIVEGLRKKGVAFRSLTEGMDTTTPHGELLFHIFGALAQYERALTKERVNAGLAAAKRRGRLGGRPVALSPEKLEAVIAALNSGTTKAAVCRNFSIPRSTLLDSLARVGWTGPGNQGSATTPRSKRKEPNG